MALYERFNREAKEGGYTLNADVDMTLQLVEGLYVNQTRYGYLMCPCRLAFGEKQKDLDVICPCDYRDVDVDEFDACFCGLYVGERVAQGKATAHSIPERRPEEYQLGGFLPATKQVAGRTVETAIPVWRCRVCGYLCAREQPPPVCPVCKAKKDRFETFEFGA
ncbi:MAG: ferredoxin:glutaredoxin reductase [Deltaproteobacteria bacterium]|nr:ferredoxin:glutaredoxin reductase [Deltaproteobacteria bacterium]